MSGGEGGGGDNVAHNPASHRGTRGSRRGLQGAIRSAPSPQTDVNHSKASPSPPASQRRIIFPPSQYNARDYKENMSVCTGFARHQISCPYRFAGCSFMFSHGSHRHWGPKTIWLGRERVYSFRSPNPFV